MLKLTSFVSPQAIVPQLKSVDRDAVIAELVDAVIAAGAAPAEVRSELLSRVLDREKRGSTGFGKGVAVPHVKHKQVAKMTAAIGVSARGIEFNALDKQPVFSVVLLLSPEDRPEEHLQAMEVIFKNLSKDTFRRFLKQSTTVDQVRSLLEESDGNHLAG
ncbi:MAG: PTS sugar transporter subunit IIA [bacterium]|nr:PTS sugar transporter subunit IIA [bacterium]